MLSVGSFCLYFAEEYPKGKATEKFLPTFRIFSFWQDLILPHEINKFSFNAAVIILSSSTLSGRGHFFCFVFSSSQEVREKKTMTEEEVFGWIFFYILWTDLKVSFFVFFFFLFGWVSKCYREGRTSLLMRWKLIVWVKDEKYPFLLVSFVVIHLDCAFIWLRSIKAKRYYGFVICLCREHLRNYGTFIKSD